MALPSATAFDAEEMRRLATSDPHEFARRREVLLHQLIASSRQPNDIANLQMDLDAARYSVAPGLRTAMRMSNLLRERASFLTAQLAILNDLLNAPLPSTVQKFVQTKD